MFFQEHLKRETCQDRLKVQRYERIYLIHKISRIETQHKRAQHLLIMEKTVHWSLTQLPSEFGTLPSFKMPDQIPNQDEVYADIEKDMRTVVGKEQLGFVNYTHADLYPKDISRHHIHNMQVFGDRVVEQQDKLRGLDRLFDLHLENEVKYMALILKIRKGLVLFPIQDIFQNASNEEKREKRRLHRVLQKLNWRVLQADHDLRMDTEKNLTEIEKLEPPAKRQKTFDCLKMHADPK